MVNAGRYSRGAVAMAFEMIGGVESFAEWAEENKGDFYTKMFTKLIGRETEVKQSDDVESLLDALDGEATDITDAEIVEVEEIIDEDDLEPVDTKRLRMMRAAEMYANAEPLED